MAKTQTSLSESARGRIIDTVLILEFPDNPGAALGKHTSVRSTGPDWGRISEFDQRREELNDPGRCPDERLVDILCTLHEQGLPSPSTPAEGKSEATAPPKTRGGRRFRFER